MSDTCFCTQCGQPLPVNLNFCPYCGKQLAKAVTKQPQKDLFYVFAAQGPAFGSPNGDMVLEKANTLKDEYSPAKNMKLKLVRPAMWNARIQSNSTSGMISVSYSMDNFTDEIRQYLKKEGIPDDRIEKGIALSAEKALQLSNPMSGVFVMGIPIIQNEQDEAAKKTCSQTAEETTDKNSLDAALPGKKESRASCQHQFKHNVCTKCGEKAPKPVLTSLGTNTQNQYTYEYYRAASAEEAKYFLEQTEITTPLYYVMVKTPEGNWGRDKDGMFLERLCGFQRNLSLAQCNASPDLYASRMLDLQMAANKIADNYLLGITCGACGFHWMDGVAHRAKTVVKCPECGKYNLVDTDNIRFNNR